MPERVVRQKAGRRVSQRVVSPGVTAREAPERLLQVVGDVAFRRPAVAVGGENAIAVEVIQQYELLGQGMLVGSDIAPEDTEPRVAVALRQVTEHLVVG